MTSGDPGPPRRPRPPRAGTDTRQTRRPGPRDTIIRPPRHPDAPPPPDSGPGGRRPAVVLAALAALVIVAGAIGVIAHAVLSSDRHPARRQEHASTTGRPHASAPRPAATAGARSHLRAGPIRALSGAGMPAGPVPPRFVPTSFTAVAPARWWLLGTAPCASPPCTSILRTDDGGRTFVGIPAPRTDHVGQLRFAEARDGFAFDPALWVTHDDGAGWHAVSMPGTVADLATSGGFAYAIVQNPSGHGALMRSPVGADAWRRLPAAGAAQGGLWVQGRDVVLESAGPNGQAAQLLVSTDAGQSFSRQPVPPSVACNFALAQGPAALWAHCATGMLSGIWRAGGAPGAAALQRASGRGLPELPNSAAFAAASATTAITGAQRLYRTIDGGTTWAPVRAPATITSWRYLGFTDALRGVALGAAGSGALQLLHTSDGGASYQRIRVG